jgi:GTP-binding protein
MAARFLKSAVNLSDCPQTGLAEVAMVGRSNAGKSSLINAWLGGRFAKVSQTPGKTQLLNFFAVDNEFVLVDMPGYGYSAKGKDKRESWTAFVESYLANAPNLKGVILVMDGGRNWSEDEDNLLDWLDQHGRPVILVLNKVDKLNQKERSAQQRQIEGALSRSKSPLAALNWVSATKKKGIDELRRSVFENFLRV